MAETTIIGGTASFNFIPKGISTVIDLFGKDTLLGGAGNTTYILQGSTTVLLTGGSGTSTIFAHGDDTIFAGSGNATVFGDADPLFFVGGTGNAVVQAGAGSSTLFGGSGPGTTTFSGGSGNATLIGGAGPTTLIGGSGKTDAFAGTGPTTMIGGSGAFSFDGTASSKPEEVFTGSRYGCGHLGWRRGYRRGRQRRLHDHRRRGEGYLQLPVGPCGRHRNHQRLQLRRQANLHRLCDRHASDVGNDHWRFGSYKTDRRHRNHPDGRRPQAVLVVSRLDLGRACVACGVSRRQALPAFVQARPFIALEGICSSLCRQSYQLQRHDCIEIIDCNAIIDYDDVMLIAPTP